MQVTLMLLLAAAMVVSIVCAIVVKSLRITYNRNKNLPMKQILSATSENIIAKSISYGVDEHGKRELDGVWVNIDNMEIRAVDLMRARRGVDSMTIYINPVYKSLAKDRTGSTIAPKSENKFIGNTVLVGESSTIRILIQKIDEITTPLINMEEI